MTRITLVSPSLVSGGAERVMSTLANAWAERGESVTLFTLDAGVEPFYPLSPQVAYRPLDMVIPPGDPVRRGLRAVGRMRMLRRAIAASRPDVVLSFLETTNVKTLLVTRGLGIPVVVEEHTDPAKRQLGASWVKLRAALYPRADRVVVLSDAARAYFSPVVQARSVIVPNPIVVDPPLPIAPAPGGRKTLISLGRLGPEKGYDLLLDAFARVAPHAPDWDLVVWGDGLLRGELEAQRDRLQLSERVRLPGRTTEPHAKLRAADLFVMSSRREGFPMALGEAMACGLPAVSTDCESGPRQIIRHGVDGLLVPPEDSAALADALLRVMRDDAQRAALAARAPEVLDRFGLERVLALWDDLFAKVIGERARGRDQTGRSGGIAAPIGPGHEGRMGLGRRARRRVASRI